MSVKGDRKISWGNTKTTDKPPNYGWSEDATNLGKLIFRLYYDNNKKGVYLFDSVEGITYEVPYGAKAKGYVLAMKLFSNR